MGLQNTKLNDVKIDEINAASVNSFIKKLIDNDTSMIMSNGIAPTIWEKRWYLDSSVKGYSVGDAVWLNTEDVDEFVKYHQDEIYKYTIGDRLLRKTIDTLSGDQNIMERLLLYKQFITGQYDPAKGAVYYLGELSAPVKLKISKVNNNKALPTDQNTQYWEDFFTYQTKESVQSSIYDEFEDQTVSAFEQHIDDYHLSGQTELTALSDTYLLNDMSNISGNQLFNSHYWYHNTLTGFDHIRYFAKRRYSDKSFKWVRAWDSGYLEHGGTVDVSNPTAGDVATAGTYRVQLAWSDDNGMQVPTFDYPSNGFQQYYQSVSRIRTATNSIEALVQPHIGSEKRYSVELTHCSSAEPYVNSAKNDSIEAFCFENSSFQFLMPTTGGTVSYIATGYSQNAARS